MALLEKTKQLCQLYDIRPARSRGQNFLIKEEVYEKIIEAADLKADDTVLEVGPGLGFLTASLAKIVKKVVAVELDDKLAKVLKTGLVAQGIKNVEIVNEDILRIFNFQFSIFNEIQNPKFKSGGYKIVANLPYNITSIFLRKFLSDENKPEMMVLMLQKEVAERIAARPPKMSLLAISVQFYSEPEIIEIVPANCFWPKPEVDSAIIKLKIKNKKSKMNEADFFRMVKIGFSAKRKMLKNNLAAGYHLAAEETEEKVKRAGFNPKIRAQELSLEDWIKLFGEFI
ncbi:MAG: 16S rRNA (adenine(1518)-N(6)/adenine(1519)-N(6))-dimethyltransferase RsmA [Patescibacteria group bacterium]|nr:16S rRNA (adenine(1518)-N(6)/adenine(1519)-N(6))-dimethyltransferase RsmA [Patescibacteria group bacterium]